MIQKETTIFFIENCRFFLVRLKGILLDAGVGTLAAVASLMDNDQDEDPKEKKKKLDAKDAGSNVGFALGSAIGLAATLLAKGKQQDEDISETLTEEPDAAEEIDIATYEESEDLDEDEGFSLQMRGKRTCSTCSLLKTNIQNLYFTLTNCKK